MFYILPITAQGKLKSRTANYSHVNIWLLESISGEKQLQLKAAGRKEEEKNLEN